jgi:hypothetical protein
VVMVELDAAAAPLPPLALTSLISCVPSVQAAVGLLTPRNGGDVMDGGDRGEWFEIPRVPLLRRSRSRGGMETDGVTGEGGAGLVDRLLDEVC